MNKARSLICLSIMSWGLPGLSDANEIFIKGVLRDRQELNRAGQSVIVRPTEETRFDLDTQFKNDPSVILSSENTSGGFSLPLFRGQDARSTHVFVGDIELRDPYSGLPMVDEIDLRGFGSMTIHKGFSPWNIPVLEPGGVIQFKSRTLIEGFEAGGSKGNFAGDSGWGRAGIGSGGTFAQVYARRSVSRGADQYYDDRGTVLNKSDDRMATRMNNDRQSQQGLLVAGLDSLAGKYSGLTWISDSKSGIPPSTSDGYSEARTAARTGAQLLKGEWSVGRDSMVRLHAGEFFARRDFKDPGNGIGFASARSLRVRSQSLKVAGEHQVSNLRLMISVGHAKARTSLDSNYKKDVFAPVSSINQLFGGMLIDVSESSAIEVKSGMETHTAKSRSVEGEESGSPGTDRSAGGSLGWSFTSDRFWLYAQSGAATRAPSLLERVGNGAEIDGAPDLRPERVTSAEFGGRVTGIEAGPVPIQLGGDIWTRYHQDMITIDNVSATRWRARNKNKRRYIGAEVRSDAGNDSLGIESGVSWIQATDVTTGALVRRLPVWQAVAGGRWTILRGLTIRGQSHYTGRMYDDDANLREVGWNLTHDASLDFVSLESRYKAGLAVRNLTNVVSSDVTDTATGNDNGRQTYRGFSGEPVSGRNWVASVSRQF